MTDNEIIKALGFVARYCKDEYNEIRVDHLLLSTLDLIKRQQEEIEKLKVRAIVCETRELLLDHATLVRVNWGDALVNAVKVKAIKEFAEKTDKMITEIYNKHIFGNNDLEDEEKEAIMDFSLDVTSGFDDLVKEMTE